MATQGASGTITLSHFGRLVAQFGTRVRPRRNIFFTNPANKPTSPYEEQDQGCGIGIADHTVPWLWTYSLWWMRQAATRRCDDMTCLDSTRLDSTDRSSRTARCTHPFWMVFCELHIARMMTRLIIITKVAFCSRQFINVSKGEPVFGFP